MSVTEGDVYTYPSPEGGWHAAKVLRITQFGDREPTAHVLIYQALPQKPSLATLHQANVLVWHAPIALSGAAQDADMLGNQAVKSEELIGYHEYLKRTDFRGYLSETGQSSEEVIARSQAAFTEGGRLSDEKRFEEAIVAYDQAIDLFPLYWEAIDNKAFAQMDLGRFEEAISTFEESLRVEADNPVAVFSIGECHLKMGEYKKAVELFAECVKRWPDQKHHHEFLDRARALIVHQTGTRKPWWKRW
jgi:tetratricopeptide (TPR) repeat protein